MALSSIPTVFRTLADGFQAAAAPGMNDQLAPCRLAVLRRLDHEVTGPRQGRLEQRLGQREACLTVEGAIAGIGLERRLFAAPHRIEHHGECRALVGFHLFLDHLVQQAYAAQRIDIRMHRRQHPVSRFQRASRQERRVRVGVEYDQVIFAAIMVHHPQELRLHLQKRPGIIGKRIF